MQSHLYQDPFVKVLSGGVYSRPTHSTTACPPAGHTNEPEVVSSVIFAHERTTAVTLAGVDATLHITSTQVVGLDGPSIPPAAVAELGVNEMDHGLLQDIGRSSRSFLCGTPTTDVAG